MRQLEDRFFVGFVVVVSLLMAWIVLPFYGAILWGLVAAIVFGPFNRALLIRMPSHRNSAAAITLVAIIAIVIFPAGILASLLVDEVLLTYNNLQTQQIDIARIFQDIQAGLPKPLEAALDRMGFGNMQAVQERFSAVLTSGLRIAAGQAVNFGQSAFSFFISLGIMLYLTYFLLRDGRDLNRKIGQRIPMRAELRKSLFEKFATVIRATIKGSIVVAIVQGIIGGFVFWALDIHAALLWGVVMGLLSLVPAIGTGLIWVPVSIYLFATGSIWQGVVLVICGALIIGSVDNILRPLLVGKDTRMPDYVVLISTLGGISVLGINGFILGPVVAALFIAAWEIFDHSRGSEEILLPEE
jgi:predicted PurR-regulated permease PerM